MNAQRKALELALSPFDPDFDQEAWTETFESFDPDDLNEINTVVAAYSSMVMNLTEIIKTGTQLTGLWPKGRPRVESALETVVTDGGLTQTQADLIGRLFFMRGRVSHGSPDVRAIEFREHIVELRRRPANRLIRWQPSRGAGGEAERRSLWVMALRGQPITPPTGADVGRLGARNRRQSIQRRRIEGVGWVDDVEMGGDRALHRWLSGEHRIRRSQSIGMSSTRGSRGL